MKYLDSKANLTNNVSADRNEKLSLVTKNHKRSQKILHNNKESDNRPQTSEKNEYLRFKFDIFVEFPNKNKIE